MLSYGKIVQVSGPVVDCEFQEGQLPKIREALRVKWKTKCAPWKWRSTWMNILSAASCWRPAKGFRAA